MLVELFHGIQVTFERPLTPDLNSKNNMYYISTLIAYVSKLSLILVVQAYEVINLLLNFFT
jgi:hypothetical protein